jgi:hypothetical protein
MVLPRYHRSSTLGLQLNRQNPIGREAAIQAHPRHREHHHIGPAVSDTGMMNHHLRLKFCEVFDSHSVQTMLAPSLRSCEAAKNSIYSFCGLKWRASFERAQPRIER